MNTAARDEDNDEVGQLLGDRGPFMVPLRVAQQYASLRNMPVEHAQREMTLQLLEARILCEESPSADMKARYQSRTQNIDMTVWLRRHGPLWIVKAATINNRVSRNRA